MPHSGASTPVRRARADRPLHRVLHHDGPALGGDRGVARQLTGERPGTCAKEESRAPTTHRRRRQPCARSFPSRRRSHRSGAVEACDPFLTTPVYDSSVRTATQVLGADFAFGVREMAISEKGVVPEVNEFNDVPRDARRRQRPGRDGRSGDVGRRQVHPLRHRRPRGPHGRRQPGGHPGEPPGPARPVVERACRSRPRSTTRRPSCGSPATCTAARRAVPMPRCTRCTSWPPGPTASSRASSTTPSSSSCRRRTPTVATIGQRRNLYGFDMNRDWFARTQPETDGKLDVVRLYPPMLFHRRARVRPVRLLLPAECRPRVPRDPGHGARLDQRLYSPAIVDAVRGGGHQVLPRRAVRLLRDRLRRHRPDDRSSTPPG